MNTGNTSNSEAEDRRLEVLISDYEMAREDERSFLSVLAAIFSVSTALLGAITVLLQQTCAFDYRSGCYRLPEYLLAAIPLLPIASLAFLQAMGLLSIIRTYYLRALEVELQTYTLRPLQALEAITSTSYMSLLNEITSLKRGRRGFRFLVGIMLLTVLVIFGGLAIYIAVNLSAGPRLAMAVVYIPLSALIAFELLNIAMNGRAFFTDICESYLRKRYTHPLPIIQASPPPGASRSVSAYLIIPRPDDLPKILIAPTILVSLVALGGVNADLRAFTVLWLTFELLIYPSRYQWNDIRGYAEDINHPELANKSRLPIMHTKRAQRRVVALSSTAIFVKVILAVLVGHFTGLLISTIWLLGATIVTSVIYETARSTGPLTNLKPISTASLAVWLSVGFGYAIRAGLAVFGAGLEITSLYSQLLVWAVAVMGVMVVLLIWTLDAASYCTGDCGSPAWRVSADVLRKPHLATLLWYIDNQPAVSAQPATASYTGSTQPVLQDRGHTLAPWNIAGVSATALTTLAAANVPGQTAPTLTVSIVGTIAACISFLLVALASTTRVRLGILLATIPFVALLTFANSRSALIAAPMLVVGLIYTSLRRSTFRELRTGPKVAFMQVIALLLRVARAFVGRSTWQKLQ